MSLPIVPRDLRNPPHYRTSTGVDPLTNGARRQMATNVPVGNRDLQRIASSVNAGMYPKKRVRDSLGAMPTILRVNALGTYHARKGITPDTTNRIASEAKPMPRMAIVMSRRGATIIQHGI